jgi:hypothetical protein
MRYWVRPAHAHQLMVANDLSWKLNCRVVFSLIDALDAPPIEFLLFANICTAADVRGGYACP